MRNYFVIKFLEKKEKIFAENEIWTTNVLIRIHLLYHLSYPGIYELSELFLKLMTSQVFIFFSKKKFWITNLELHFFLHRSPWKFWLGLVHGMVHYRNKSNPAPQIHPTANLEFFSFLFINRNLVFGTKTAKWPLFLGLQSQNVKSQ